MHRLVQLGIRMAVYEFWTSYSSLSYLHNLSIVTLEIDRAFVENIPGNKNNEAIAKTIIGLDNSLHLLVEDVVTEQQQAFLSEPGCQSMQSYLFSKPVTAEEFTRLIEAEHNSNH